MTAISISRLRKTYDGGNTVIDELDLQIHAGEFMVFVGPSGCGKTTLLRMLAGLEPITAGDIHFGDQRVNELEPVERGAAMVFQSYALYPHMTVAQNLGFGLKMAGIKSSEREAAVRRVAQTLQLEALLERKPKALSGGQRQRVAIGRAIVRQPKVFLFDEPLSNLDAGLRMQMRVELARLHRELGTTMVYVTHDQVEAMTLGQRIAVFNAGRIEQVGTPLTLYQQPATRFVAEFLGAPKMNLLPAQAVLEARWPLPQALAVHALSQLGVRPEDLELLHENSGAAGAAEGGLRARISLVEHLGDSTLVHLVLPAHGTTLAARLNGAVHHWQADQWVCLRAAFDKLHPFDAQGRRLPS
jgi:multiple sugar transport system ATP-binding protein